MIKRVIFDIDGTLIKGVDFRPYIRKALNLYLEKINQNYNDEAVDNMVKTFIEYIKPYEEEYLSYDKNNYINFFKEKLGVDLGNGFLEIFFEVLQDAIPQNGEQLKRIGYLLKHLQEKGYEIVLLSNFFQESQMGRLKKMGIDHYFHTNDGTPYYFGENPIKPNEYAYIAACGNHKPSECLMIGDDIILDIEIPKKFELNTLYTQTDKPLYFSKIIYEITRLNSPKTRKRVKP